MESTLIETPGDLSVDMERLKSDLAALSEIGRGDDHGIYRMGFTDADMTARQWFRDRAGASGLETAMDAAGNVFARIPNSPHQDRPAVLMGSHLDSVVCGGTLDGALGVVVALECLRRIRESGVQLAHPVEVVGFSDEEGRFGGMFGSQAFCGEVTPETIHTAVDLDGVKLEEEMRRHGMDPMRALEARRDPRSLHAFLELHIEQGPVLHRMRKQVGIVEAITGLVRWTVRLIGTPNHAGTTPMAMRDDAFMGLADFAHEIPRVLEENGSELSRATVGKVEIAPGSANTVPGLVEFSLDFRDTSAAVLGELDHAFRKALSAIARRRRLLFEYDPVSYIEPVECSPDIVAVLEAQAARLELDVHRMPSGAAHDAQLLARITRTGMVFVPSKDGQSHSPAEWTAWSDVEAGANLSLQTLLQLAEISEDNAS